MPIKEKGSAIIMILIVAAIMLTTSIALISLISSAEKSTANRRKEEKLFEIIRSISMRINDSVDCSAMLAGNNFSTLTPTIETPITIATSFGSDANIAANYLKDGKVFGDGLTIQNITIRAITAPGIAIPIDADKRFYTAAALVPHTAAATTKYLAEIKFYTQSIIWNPSLEEKKIKLFIKVRNSTQKIWECHGYDSPAESCEVVSKGTYNPNMAAGFEAFRCNPDKICFSLKGPVNGLFTAAICPNPTLYKSQYVGNMSGVNYYLCNWCNFNRP